jgi:hypothetical protein
MYKGVMQLIAPIRSPCMHRTPISTHICGIIRRRLRTIAHALENAKHFLLEKRSTKNSAIMDPNAPIKLGAPVSKPSVAALG